VTSPNLDHPVPVVAAKVSYVKNGNGFQNIQIYLPNARFTHDVIGKPVSSLFATPAEPGFPSPHVQVHIHGGAWRDPNLTATSIEAAVAHTFSGAWSSQDRRITAIVSINYTLSPFPNHPELPYHNNPERDAAIDLSRSAAHPQHIYDVLQAFVLLRSLGLQDGSYVLSGHSAGACLVAQTMLAPPSYWNFEERNAPPRPAAILCMNGLYDLPDLVDALGATHQHLQEVYADLITIAFGSDRGAWASASPTRLSSKVIATSLQEGGPTLVVLDQSPDDQLVPINQTDKFEALMRSVHGLKVVRANRCVGKHAAPWEEGYIISDGVQDVLKILDKDD
jgi:kynurenine formamidase